MILENDGLEVDSGVLKVVVFVKMIYVFKLVFLFFDMFVRERVVLCERYFFLNVNYVCRFVC